MSTIAALLEQLPQAILEYLEAVGDSTDIRPLVEGSDASRYEYSGVGFGFDVGRAGDSGDRLWATGLFIDIDKLFDRVGRYTSQKSRFITAPTSGGDSGTRTGLYAFTPDERALYLLFLKEGADRLWSVTSGYGKWLPFKAYLFDEGLDIREWDAGQTWISGTIVDHDGTLFRALSDVPVGISIEDGEYWTETTPLYRTRGKVAYFIEAGYAGTSRSIPWNALVKLLYSLEDALSAFVLWRWYTLAGIRDEASAWLATYDQAKSEAVLAASSRYGVLQRGSRFF